MGRRGVKCKRFVCPTKGHNLKNYETKNSYGETNQNVLQRMRNTWGINSYTAEHMIKEFDRIKLDLSNDIVVAQIDREIKLLESFIKENK